MAHNTHWEQSVNEEDATVVKTHYESKGLRDFMKTLKKVKDQWVDIPIHVAVFGSSGAGKSSFINVIRGLKAEDKNGAALNVGQTTIEPIPYSHPNKHYLKFWDLPQLGSRAFSHDLYLKNSNIDKYDYFIIFTKSSFTEDDFWFAHQLIELKKKFYFVCTHMDLVIDAALKQDTNSNNIDIQIKTLANIRKDLIRSVKAAGVKVEYVYLITTEDVRKFDFPKLAHRLIVDLPDRKWEAMALTLNVLAEDVIKQKRRALQKRVWVIGLMSGIGNPKHFYGLKCDVDLDPVLEELQEYRRQFCLDNASIHRLAASIDTSVKNLRTASSFKTNYEQLEEESNLVNMYKTLSVYNVPSKITKSFLPLLGNLIAGDPPFGLTYYVLNKFLDTMETDALRMIDYVRYRAAEV